MYGKLWSVLHRKSLLRVKDLRFSTVNLYHSDNAYYGYRPVAKKDLKIPDNVVESRKANPNLFRYVQAYRNHGHRLATINPVHYKNVHEFVPELDLTSYGLNASQSIKNIEGLVYFSDSNIQTISDLEKSLKERYSYNVSAEFEYIEDQYEREWFAEKYEKIINEKNRMGQKDKKEIAELMIKCQTWDQFLATKFPTVKRYGGEGAESMVAFFRSLFIESTKNEINTIVLGMPHRGRLNLLTTMFKQKPAKVFRKFKGLPEFGTDAKAMMDIASHFNASVDIEFENKSVHLSMVHNPSHLEAVNPVVLGKARSKQQSLRDGAFSVDEEKEFGTDVLSVILHGDAAISGQGVNQECLMMSKTPNYDVGGTIHLICNNQIGYTTPGDRGCCSRYSSDIAKSINSPVIHVNGDDPELVHLVSKLAFEYQRKFRKDVFIDYNCFRRWGHNEMDDPTFTNPLMYKVIHNRKSIPDLYAEKLVSENVMAKAEVESIHKKHFDYLNEELKTFESYVPEKTYFEKQWSGLEQAPNGLTIWDTGVSNEVIWHVAKASIYTPPDFKVHSHLQKTFVNNRMKRLSTGKSLDWATAEAIAFGSLMYQGYNVRLSGEDVGRGTFSQRHAMLVDQETAEVFVPLNAMKGGNGGKLEIAHSILSEEAVLGFEYGFSIDNPNNLVIWEAQFGDFFNGAQIIIDTYVASSETKWMISSGLVMLLPHGMDGMASEHSSCRMERFLQMTDSKEEALSDGDDVNMHVIYPTTPAQYFHALRRQMIRNFRKPLIVVGPKTLLRLSDATSTINEMLTGTHFQNVIPDVIANPNNVRKVILCTGKHYYNLNNERVSKHIEDVALIRVESLCPFPVQEIQTELNKYKKAIKYVWSQEEHRNMGAWNFIQPRFENLVGKRIKYVGRCEAATPATGIGMIHQREVNQVVTQPFTV